MARRVEDDDPFDENGVLKDGRSVRVSLMDAAMSRGRAGPLGHAQFHDWAADADRIMGDRAARSSVVAGDGMAEGLHRPGFRVSQGDARKTKRTDRFGREEGEWEEEDEDGSTCRDSRQQAYADYQTSIQDAWKGNNNSITGAGESEVVSPKEGDVCMVQGPEYPESFGSPGHIKKIGKKMVCVPDRAASGDSATAMYESYDSALRDSWRNP